MLVKGGLDPTAAENEVLYGMRVHMANEAYMLGISQERRAALGKWAKPSNSEVYTRDHANVICGIWNEVMEKRPSWKDIEKSHVVPINLCH